MAVANTSPKKMKTDRYGSRSTKFRSWRERMKCLSDANTLFRYCLTGLLGIAIVACAQSSQVTEAVTLVKWYYAFDDTINQLHPLQKELGRDPDEPYDFKREMVRNERLSYAELQKRIDILDTIIGTEWNKDRLEVKLVEKGKKFEMPLDGVRFEFIPIKVQITVPYKIPGSNEQILDEVHVFFVGKDLFGKLAVLKESGQRLPNKDSL
jgi:hypothetical protein